jgi:hypothetical protein
VEQVQLVQLVLPGLQDQLDLAELGQQVPLELQVLKEQLVQPDQQGQLVLREILEVQQVLQELLV